MQDVILAPKHQGFKVSAPGVLGRIADGAEVEDDLRFCCGELLGHLKIMAQAYYSGELQVVDQFLQLYCLDEFRPKERTHE